MLRKLYVLTIVLTATVASVMGQGKPKADGAESQRGIEVMAVVSKWADAVRDRNMKALDLLFAEDLVITTADGSIRGKKEELEFLKPNPETRTTAIANDDVGIKIFGNVAVVTALAKMTFAAAGKESATEFRYTAVFVKTDGRWQMTALQTARPSKPKTTVN